MKKAWGRIVSILLIFLSLIIGVIAVFPNYAYEFKLNTQKYAQANLHKNTGIKKVLLQIVQMSTSLLPQPARIHIKREKNLIGFAESTFIEVRENNQINVTTEEQFLSALRVAKPGDHIILAAGEYRIKKPVIGIKASGTALLPITISGDPLSQPRIKLESLEGFKIMGSHLTIQNIEFVGTCDFDWECDHALHLVGDIENIVIKNNVFMNFNAHIKSNGLINDNSKERHFPDHVLIDNNNFINEWRRETSKPVTPVDVVGGDDWQIQNNFIADFSKAGGDQVSYGLFLKGGGKRGIVNNNLVICEWQVHSEKSVDTRIGLSFGGGGSGVQYCQQSEQGCNNEHDKGKMINNTVLNCPNDVAIYINQSSNIEISHNIMLNTLGMDVRFAQTSVNSYDNIFHGRIKKRDGAQLTSYNDRVLSIFQDNHLD